MTRRVGSKGAKGPRKGKGKRESNPVPTTIDAVVTLPSGSKIDLRVLSIDTVADVRELLADSADFCHATSYSLHDQVNVDVELDESAKINSKQLQPCRFQATHKPYATYEDALSNVRRFIDIAGTVTNLGPVDTAIDEDVERAGEKLCPPAQLSRFYAFFSCAQVPPLIQGIESLERVGASSHEVSDPDQELLRLTVVVASGARLHVVASCRGFCLANVTDHSAASTAPAAGNHEQGQGGGVGGGDRWRRRRGLDPGPPPVPVWDSEIEGAAPDPAWRGGRMGIAAAAHATLTELLEAEDTDFRDRYAALLAAFRARNPFGQVPVGLRGNTWLAPGLAPGSSSLAVGVMLAAGRAEVAMGGGGGGGGRIKSIMINLPAEDEDLGGTGGGDDDTDRPRLWHSELSAYCALPGTTAEERLARDRRVFLAHTHFVDRATRRAVEAARGVISTAALAMGSCGPAAATAATSSSEDAMLIEAAPVDPEFEVAAAWCGARGARSSADVAASTDAAVLRGVAACERTASEDVGALTRVVVHLGGQRVEVRADPAAVARDHEPWAMEDEPAARDGGANALNPSSLRIPLHCSGEDGIWSEGEGEKLVASVLSRAAAAAGGASAGPPPSPPIRSELAATWLRHLAQAEDMGEREAGPGKPSSFSISSSASGFSVAPMSPTKAAGDTLPAHAELVARLGSEGASRLAGLPGSVHAMSPQEVVAAVAAFRDCPPAGAEGKCGGHGGAVGRLLRDFGSLELSPVDGRTLTDFLHVRGLNMRALGRVAEQAGTLTHVRELCVGEMAARALKRLLRAALATAAPGAQASVAAALLNAALGEGHPLGAATWSWVNCFASARFDFDLGESSLLLRGVPLLRGICLKVGLEIRAADYDFSLPRPFRARDILALVPVVKSAPYTSSDGRSLLEASKAALDKGRLEEAVSSGAAAVQKIGAVCGPRSRASAGALSLLAVALYHAGSFAPAAACQQRALRACERELGLDHPDTMKAYGDQAVFYYRLGHNTLAIRYVNRALYLLQLTAGSEHPNTAATYINRGMMEEGVGRVGTALRFLQAALECNRRILGADHVQTAASYHAIAIALSLMDPPAYALSVQHEQTTLDILERKLGPSDPRSQDSQAWLDYFGSAQGGGPPPDASVASKGHLPVDDLMRFIGDAGGEGGTKAGGGGEVAAARAGLAGAGAEKRRSRGDDDAAAAAAAAAAAPAMRTPEAVSGVEARAGTGAGLSAGSTVVVADSNAGGLLPSAGEAAGCGGGSGKVDGGGGNARRPEEEGEKAAHGGTGDSGMGAQDDLGDGGWELAVRARARGKGAAPPPLGGFKEKEKDNRPQGAARQQQQRRGALGGARVGAGRGRNAAAAPTPARAQAAGAPRSPPVEPPAAAEGAPASASAGVSYASLLVRGGVKERQGGVSAAPPVALRRLGGSPGPAAPLVPFVGSASTTAAAAAVGSDAPPTPAQGGSPTSPHGVSPERPLDPRAPVFLPAARRCLNPTAKAFVPSSPRVAKAAASGAGEDEKQPHPPLAAPLTMAEKLARSLQTTARNRTGAEAARTGSQGACPGGARGRVVGGGGLRGAQ